MVHAIVERKMAAEFLLALKFAMLRFEVLNPRLYSKGEYVLRRSLLWREMRDLYVKFPSSLDDWTMTHAYFANMGGIQVNFKHKGSDGSIIDSRRPSRRFNTKQIIAAAQMGVITDVQTIPLKEIEDRSKTDLFTKGLALLQILWLVASLITRWVQHLAVSQLEIVATAFAVCTVVTYFFCLPKPQDVQIPIDIEAYEVENRQDVDALVSLQSVSLARYLLEPNSPPVTRWFGRIPDDNFEPSSSFIQPAGPILSFATVCYLSWFA